MRRKRILRRRLFTCESLQIAQALHRHAQHAHVALAVRPGAARLRQPQFDVAHLPLGGADQPVAQRVGIGAQRARALAEDIAPARIGGNADVDLRLAGDGRTTRSSEGDIRIAIRDLRLTRVAVQGITLPDLALTTAAGTAELKGTRLEIRDLHGERPELDESRPLLGKPTPCVGRELELIQLQANLANAIEENAPKAAFDAGLARASLPGLIAKLGDANGWVRDTAQRLLVEKRDPAVAPALHQVICRPWVPPQLDHQLAVGSQGGKAKGAHQISECFLD